MVYPALSIVFGRALTAFQQTSDPDQLKRDSNRNALWYFITAIAATIAIVWQQYSMGTAAENLCAKLRQLSFKAIMRHDIEWFDEDTNSVSS